MDEYDVVVAGPGRPGRRLPWRPGGSLAGTCRARLRRRRRRWPGGGQR